MNVSVTAEAAALIHGKVAIGLYQDSAEVIDEALRLLDARDRERRRLRESIAHGFAEIKRGEGVELTVESMLNRSHRATERAARGDQPSLDVCP
ncbi:MAG: type II toxin-antitoxin system ParD family antitoxin [Thermomicrobiales bacterium]